MTFDAVALPAGVRGGYGRAALDEALRGWAESAPVRALAKSSGWVWPDAGDTRLLLDRLVDLSRDWDFRRNRERNFIDSRPVEVNGRPIDAVLITEAARALGMVDATEVTGRRFSHLVVLSGLVRACINRTERAAKLARHGVAVGRVVALGAHRMLGGAEPEQARVAGLGVLVDEAEVILAATRREFGLGEPLSAEEARAASDPSRPETFHAASAHYRWPSVEVVIAPSADPLSRRANTADQFRHWASLAGLGSEHDVLVLTTQIYVPYQHMEAVRILGLERGCGVYSCGVDVASALLRRPPFSGRDYLQEVRSALCAASLLLRAASTLPEASTPR